MAYAKRWLFLIHRWLGIFACIFFVMWFISGIVMMYVGYPKLTAAERIQHLPPLNAAAITLTPRQALDAAGIKGPLQELRLAVASGGRAVYLAVPARDLNVGLASGRRRVAPASGTVVIDASTGVVSRQVDRAHVLASAAVFGGSAVATDYGGIIDEDAFTHSRALDAHRPLHRVWLADADATLLYVSSTTGEVVRDAPRIERLWNYVGAWIHWLYPFRGNMFNAYWTDIVIWLSILGIGLVFTGATVGIMRWRFTRVYKRGSHSPYHGFVMRWHHILGLLFALVTLTWIFSGLMSMNPWKIFDSGAKALNTVAMNGGPLNISSQQASPQQLLAAAPNGVRELHWIRTSGQTLVLANISGSARPTVFNAESANVYVPDLEALKANVARLLPDPVARIEVLADYDLYYYSREPHTMTGGSEKFLPVWRVIFDNAHATWVHIDPATGTVLGHTDSTKRLSRWLFAMLHSWDWLPMLERRPLWDIVLISLSLCGTALSLSGVVIGWRRLGRKFRSVRVRRFARL